MNKLVIALLIALLGGVLLIGCGQKQPTVKEVEKKLEKTSEDKNLSEDKKEQIEFAKEAMKEMNEDEKKDIIKEATASSVEEAQGIKTSNGLYEKDEALLKVTGEEFLVSLYTVSYENLDIFEKQMKGFGVDKINGKPISEFIQYIKDKKIKLNLLGYETLEYVQLNLDDSRTPYYKVAFEVVTPQGTKKYEGIDRGMLRLQMKKEGESWKIVDVRGKFDDEWVSPS